jgi:hypothetical protein
MTTNHPKSVGPTSETLCISNIHHTKTVIKPIQNLYRIVTISVTQFVKVVQWYGLLLFHFLAGLKVKTFVRQ